MLKMMRIGIDIAVMRDEQKTMIPRHPAELAWNMSVDTRDKIPKD